MPKQFLFDKHNCSDLAVPFEENVSKLKLLLFYYYGLKLENGSIGLTILCQS